MAPDTFKFWCPSCGQHIAANRSDVGVRADCPACGMPLVVPEPAADSAACDCPVADGPCAHGVHHGLRIPAPQPPASNRRAYVVALAIVAILLVVAVAVLMRPGGRFGRTPFHPAHPGCELHVAVLDSGELLADGQRVDFDRLGELLVATKRDNGVVRLYQESGSGRDGGVLAGKVAHLIDQLLLPVTRAGGSENLDPYLKGPAGDGAGTRRVGGEGRRDAGAPRGGRPPDSRAGGIAPP